MSDIREEYINKILESGQIELINNIDESLSDEELIQKVEISKYKLRRIDGQSFSDVQGAKLVLLDAPTIVKKEIGDFFAVAQGYLAMGWWKSALRDLENKQPTAYVNQELLDGIRAYMAHYISISYK